MAETANQFPTSEDRYALLLESRKAHYDGAQKPQYDTLANTDGPFEKRKQVR